MNVLQDGPAGPLGKSTGFGVFCRTAPQGPWESVRFGCAQWRTVADMVRGGGEGPTYFSGQAGCQRDLPISPDHPPPPPTSARTSATLIVDAIQSIRLVRLSSSAVPLYAVRVSPT